LSHQRRCTGMWLIWRKQEGYSKLWCSNNLNMTTWHTRKISDDNLQMALEVINGLNWFRTHVYCWCLVFTTLNVWVPCYQVMLFVKYKEKQRVSDDISYRKCYISCYCFQQLKYWEFSCLKWASVRACMN
jgi:hypothetical protein